MRLEVSVSCKIDFIKNKLSTKVSLAMLNSVDLFFDDWEKEQEGSIEQLKLKRKYLRDLSNPLELSNSELSREAFVMLLDSLEIKLKPSIRSTSIPNILKLAATLRFFAEGGYQRGTGNDFNIALAQPTMSLVLKEVCDIMETFICPNWIKFNYTEEEKREAKLYFYEKCRFPGVIGCIDGTHVSILKPNEDVQHLYYNRKGFYSLNVMLVCDHKMKIRFVDARYPGATHDSIIFRMSALHSLMRGNFESGDKNTWLLGDSGYALETFLMTPFRNPVAGSIESRYNQLHSTGRNTMERTNGILKNRFRCLLGERQLHYTAEKAKQFANICVVLHNICIHYQIDFVLENEVDEDDDDVIAEMGDSEDVCQIRNLILESLRN